MSITTIDQLAASFERPLKYLDYGPANAEICSADLLARNNLDTAFHLVPRSMIRKPNINCIYFGQQYTAIPTVPVDLQLTWFLENYTKMAQEGFVAKQEGQDRMITRAIWFYGVDDYHSFSRHKRGIRANLIAMAYLMAKNFPKDICNSETERFIMAFVEAWISDLVDTGGLMTQSFTVREEFIKFWADSPFDLMRFTSTEEQKVHRLTEKLKAQSLPPNLCDKLADQPEKIIEMRRNGTITDDEFKKYGSAMVLHYILSMSELSNENRLEREIKAAKFERDMEEEVDRVQTRMGGDIRRRVKWDSKMVAALLGSVDLNLPHPSVIRRQRPQPLREAWLDKPTFFHILESGLLAMEEEVDDMIDGLDCL